MGKLHQDKLKERNEDLEDLLEYLLTQIQELREEFSPTLATLLESNLSLYTFLTFRFVLFLVMIGLMTEQSNP